VVVRYLLLAVWPHPLVFDYGEHIIVRSIAAAWPSALIVLALAAAVLVALKRWPAMGFAGAWVFVVLSPASSVVPVAGQPMAEHRMYLALAGVLVLLVMAAHQLIGKRPTLLLAILVGVAFGCRTVWRNNDYRSDEALWRDTLLRRPQNPRAYNNLGNALNERGRPAEAVTYLESALRLRPDFPEAHNNLGIALARQGKLAQAIHHFHLALRFKPDFPEAHQNLGKALSELGDTAQSRVHFEKLIQLRPYDPVGRFSFGVMLTMDGKLDEAVSQYQEAVRLKPDYAEAHNNLGIVFLLLGRTNEAAAHLEKARRLVR
jgi:Flp pilus assembly protein TadD